MTAAALVRSVVAAGMTIRVEDDRMVLSGPARPAAAHLLEDLRSAKTEVLRYLRGLAEWDPDDWSALYDERAAIMEFDSGLPRHEAEARAAEEVEQQRLLVRCGDGRR